MGREEEREMKKQKWDISCIYSLLILFVMTMYVLRPLSSYNRGVFLRLDVMWKLSPGFLRASTGTGQLRLG